MLLIFDSHPVQYKAPVYRELQRIKPGSFKVVYATDCSVRGHEDKDFGRTIAWDVPLLSGYEHVLLNNERGVPLRGFRSLTGRGIPGLLRREKPAAVLISQFLYEADLVTYAACLARRIPIWIRHETQDEAFPRGGMKTLLRSALYRIIYRGVSHAFYVGKLNREHLLRHGVKDGRMSFAPYCVDSPLPAMSAGEKARIRQDLRARLGVADCETLVLFSGKLIPKKDPRLLLDALTLLAPADAARTKAVFVGSGEMMDELKIAAARIGGGITFAGFVNQSEMPHHYLAADIVALPSRRMGETWGLVVNEALHAGCAVVMTDAVGCHREFGGWDRVRVIDVGDAAALAAAIVELARQPRSFEWCAKEMEQYSVRAAANAIASRL